MAQGMLRSPSREVKFTGTLVTINKLSFLIPNDKIVKIFDISKITEVPNTSQSIVGVINFQGEVISVIDISKLLCDTPDNKKIDYSHDNIRSRALILEFENEKVALFVDEIIEFLEIDKNQIIRTLTFENLEIGEYLFQGAIINEFEQIVLVLNVDYLHKHLIVSEDVEDARNAVVMFENHHFITPEPKYVSLDEGLLIEDSGNLFLIDSRYVSQVIVQESFLMKKYEHNALQGAAIHWGIGPLINFNNIINESNLENSQDKSIGILLHHPDSGFEATFLIEKVVGRKSSDEFEVYQPGNSFSSETISPIISGFFSYQGKLGIIINPSRLLEETTTILKDIIGLEDPTKDFISTLLPEEKEFLENIQAKRKENQLLLLLEKQEKGTRYDYFALKWQNNIFAIDIAFIDKVISSLDINIVKTKDYPIVGIAKVEEEDIPILDLASIFLDGYKKAIDFQDKHFFIFKNHDQSFVIPVDSLEGVITVFKYELLNCDQSDDQILQGKDYCKYKITNNKDSSTYLVENEFLKATITQDGINSLQIEYKKSEE